MMFRRILVGWDGSEPANAALRLATTLGGEVEALAVFSPANGELSPERYDVREKFTTLLDGRQVRFHAIFEATSPARALAAFSSDHGFDLIAVGRPLVTRDRDGTLPTLAAEARVPLLVVSPDGRGELVSTNNYYAIAMEHPHQRAAPPESTVSHRRFAEGCQYRVQ
jgi:nucleotide-binding universal stress UspA family protein